MLDHAYASGIRHIDTAVAYSAGASERIIGDWLQSNAGARPSLTIATKLLPPYTPAIIEATVAECRRRLGLERIDVLYLHRWDATVENSEVRAALDGLVRQGFVGSLGISNCTQAQLKFTLEAQQAEGRIKFACKTIRTLPLGRLPGPIARSAGKKVSLSSRSVRSAPDS